ncbi:MAG TPA: class I SAM-dependent rRNA methyltransferase [Candidatus Binatia bacterium]|nr:class I SAM-dependent rRNA methyltransferase [Candidatus Binatia bacterium]
MPEGVLRLKRGRERARTHPWIFKGDVADVSSTEPGAAVRVVDSAGQFVGRGLYNPRPALCCRLYTWRDEPLDEAFFARQVRAAVARRSRGVAPAVARLVWSEADGLPGFVCDRYGPVLVVQWLTLATAQRRRLLADALRAALGPLPVFSADEPGPADLEGFEPVRGWLDEAGPERVVVEEGPIRLAVTVGQGQKTGLYLDQRENRLAVATLAPIAGDVLDAFAYTGAFACQALAAGAGRAVCLESSPEAIAGARENFRLNGVEDRAEVVAGNAFDELRRLDREGQRFALVVLDPPPFTRSRHAVEAAARGYKEVNLRAMRLLAPGGTLLTFSCSHHVSAGLFEDIARAAATDVGVRLLVCERLTQSSDHPELLTVPETRYLKGLRLQAI